MSDKWLYAIRHLPALWDRPKALREKIFEQFFSAAEIARFNTCEKIEYEESLKAFRDWYSVLSTAQNKGYSEGLEKGMAEGMEKGMEKGEKNKALSIAQEMFADGVPLSTISRYTHLPLEILQQLLTKE